MQNTSPKSTPAPPTVQLTETIQTAHDCSSHAKALLDQLNLLLNKSPENKEDGFAQNVLAFAGVNQALGFICDTVDDLEKAISLLEGGAS